MRTPFQEKTVQQFLASLNTLEHDSLRRSANPVCRSGTPTCIPLMKKTLVLLYALAGAISFASCKKSEEAKAGKFTLLGTKTDNAKSSDAKANAENALLTHSDLAAMVGLYGYNAPQCLAALQQADKGSGKLLGKVKIFGFDDDDETLKGIKAGHIEGTVVQQPFEFGYQSMKALKDLSEGKSIASKNGIVDIPVKIITKDTVEAYDTQLKAMLAAGKAAPAAPANGPLFAFISNNQASFWEVARAGCVKAQAELGIRVDFQMPALQEASEQNRILESLLVKGDCKGVAISVISPPSQAGMLKQVSDKMPLVTHDSDAPDSARKAYFGTDNYQAGKALGKFMRERMPDGGKIMIFVGSEDAMNASERKKGLLEALQED
jgi:ribose transport system substrate-binding protein